MIFAVFAISVVVLSIFKKLIANDTPEKRLSRESNLTQGKSSLIKPTSDIMMKSLPVNNRLQELTMYEFLQPGTLQGQIYSCLKQKNHSAIKPAIFILTIQDAVAYTKKQHQHSIARLTAYSCK
jgi:hypothetical protein